jgi:predicted kinase
VEHSLVVLTGASGSGKTTLARHVQLCHLVAVDVIFFDSIGVPPIDQMARDCGSPEAWQRAQTQTWFGKISKILATGRTVLFEGQMRIAFILEALAEVGITGARLILVDCDDDVRQGRLKNDRNQPELANPTMMHWAKYLREEAKTAGIEILDTGRFSVTDCTRYICRCFGISAEASQ